MYKIMIVEDDRGIADAVTKQAESWGFSVYAVRDFQAVNEEFDAQRPDLVLLDIALPFYNGYHWCEEIRRRSNVPIIFISSAGDNMNIVMAMTMGADDFITKPFDGSVLIAKISALLRRAYDFSASELLPEYHGITLDLERCSLKYDGGEFSLSKNEVKIMAALMRARGRVVSRERIMEELWETDSFIDDNTLSVNIGRLRRRLEEAGIHDFIGTKHGVGYMLK